MGNCKKCGTPVSDKYEFCFSCSQEMKKQRENEENKEPIRFQDTQELLKAIGAMNNNLYFIRTALAVILRKDYKTEIFWDKETASFKERKAGK